MTIRIAGRTACLGLLAILIYGRGFRASGQEPPPPDAQEVPPIGLEPPPPIGLELPPPEFEPDPLTESERKEKTIEDIFNQRLKTLTPARAAGLAAESQPDLLDLRRVLVLTALRASEPDAPSDRSVSEILEQARAAGLDEPAAAFGMLRTHPETIESIRLYFQALDSYQAAREASARVFALDRGLEIYREYAQGSSAGRDSLSGPLRIETAALQAQDERDNRIAKYRDRLDVLKARLGLAPGSEVAIDPNALAGFEAGIVALNALEGDIERSVEKLTALGNQLPTPPDFVIGTESAGAVADDPGQLEPFLRATADAAVGASGLEPGADLNRIAYQTRKTARRLIEARARSKRGRQLLWIADLERSATMDQITAPPRSDDLEAALHYQETQTREYLTDDSATVARRRLVSDWIAAATARFELDALTGRIGGEDWDSALVAYTTDETDDKAPPPPTPTPK